MATPRRSNFSSPYPRPTAQLRNSIGFSSSISYPRNTRTYDYPFQRPVNIGGLRFAYDVKSFADYEAIQESEPGSDGAAMISLLAARHLKFPAKAARVRMTHLPTPDHRSELMIIYGEAISPDEKIPVKTEGIRLGDAAPDAAQSMLKHALKGLTVRIR